LAASVRALAPTLEAYSLPRGTVAAVSGPSGFGLVTAMLAILSRGWVMLPIAPDLPDQRKRLMLEEADKGGVPLAVLPAIAKLMDGYIERGHGGDDWTVIGKDALGGGSGA